MLPLRDELPASRTPVVTRAIIIANVTAFVFELSLGHGLGEFVRGWGLVPVRLAGVFAGMESPVAPAGSVLVSMFLHAGWVHLIGNMWYLWIFGDNVEDRMGRVGFLLFYLSSGFASAALHVAINPWSTVPTVGASGAIAGVLGAYLVLYPRARVITLVPIFFFIQIVPLPAIFVLGFWFVVQFFAGALSLAGGGGSGGGVAFWAHVGGFVFGLIAGIAALGAARSKAWVER